MVIIDYLEIIIPSFMAIAQSRSSKLFWDYRSPISSHSPANPKAIISPFYLFSSHEIALLNFYLIFVFVCSMQKLRLTIKKSRNINLVMYVSKFQSNYIHQIEYFI
jgi:hypothetical protein